MKKKLKILLNIRMINKCYIRYRMLYKYIRKAYTAVKAFFLFVLWMFTEKHKLYKYLEEAQNISEIKVFDFLHWKHGVKYFVGLQNNIKVFIKTGGKIDTTQREYEALCRARERSSYLAKHVPEASMEVLKDESLLIEKMIEGESLDRMADLAEKDKAEIVNQIYQIYLELRSNDICHLDVRPANFLVSMDRSNIVVYLIDFGYALVDTKDIYNYINKTNITKKVIKNLGSNYACQNGTWDDAYSFLLTLKKVEPSLLEKNYNIWKTLNEDIGINVIDMKEGKASELT